MPTEEEKAEKLRTDLDAAFEKVDAVFLKLRDDFKDGTMNEQQLLLDVMKNADPKYFEVHSNVEALHKAVKGTTEKYGASWEDVIIRFEWNKEMDTAVNGLTSE